MNREERNHRLLKKGLISKKSLKELDQEFCKELEVRKSKREDKLNSMILEFELSKIGLGVK